jgi:hypothetical protein
MITLKSKLSMGWREVEKRVIDFFVVKCAFSDQEGLK